MANPGAQTESGAELNDSAPPLVFAGLKLTGFKSFAEPVSVPILPGLTGVVGPNGCGKSNLLEAIRWTMGEAGARSLRGSAMDDVVFAGTTRRASRGFAEVVLQLERGGGGEQVEVTRRIDRGEGSTYRLNGQVCRARDVHLLFADASTGAASPALVGQGRVAALIAAKPADRRLLFEEAAGISGLHVRRREAEGRLNAAEANLLRVADAIAGFEAQVRSLKRQEGAARRYRELSTAIAAAESATLLVRWRGAVAAAAGARAAASDAGRAVDMESALAAAAATASNSAEQGRDAAREDREAARDALVRAEAVDRDAAQSLLTLRSALETAARALATAQGDRARADASSTEAERGVAAATARRDEALLTIAAAEAVLPALDVAQETASTAAAALRAELDAALAARAGHEAALGAAQRDATAAGARLEAARTALARANAAMSAMPETVAGKPDAEARVRAAVASVRDAELTLAAAERARFIESATLAAAEQAAAAARAPLAALRAEIAGLRAVLGPPSGQAASRALDAVEVDAALAQALTAALGDDLEAALSPGDGCWWAGSRADDGDAPLPPGLEPLTAHVRAPTVLQRRLAQVGLLAEGADPDGITLRPGQRMVSRAGELWRWDGFRAGRGAGGGNAALLTRAVRLRAALAELPALEEAAQAAEAQVAAARVDSTAAAAAERAARTARDAAERAITQARSDAERTRAQAADQARRSVAAAAAAAAARTALIGSQGEAAAAQARLTAASGSSPPDIPALRGKLASAIVAQAEARDAATAARGRAAQARALAEAAAREISGGQARAALTAEAAADFAARADGLTAERAAAALAVPDAEAALAAAGPALSAARERLSQSSDTLAAAEAALATRIADERATAERLTAARELRARAEADAAQLSTQADEAELAAKTRLGPLPEAGDRTPDPGALAGLLAARERLGAVNLRVEIELPEAEGELKRLTAERDAVADAILRLRGQVGAINREGRAKLGQVFAAVDAHFRVLFATLFGGGQARLELLEGDDPLDQGVEIWAEPPGKALRSLTLLSGGEQALTAVALIFALFLANPAPLCVLDEVDAPLDDANVERFCDLLDHMCRVTATRFLVVTHNAVTMSRMHRLYGVTMAEPGVSQLVTVDLGDAVELLAAE